MQPKALHTGAGKCLQSNGRRPDEFQREMLRLSSGVAGTIDYGVLELVTYSCMQSYLI